jgi:hypothetical protein
MEMVGMHSSGSGHAQRHHALMTTFMTLQAPLNSRNFLTGRQTISFSRVILFQAVRIVEE